MRSGGAGHCRRAIVVVVAVGLLLMSPPFAATAGAQSYETWEACIDARPISVDPMSWSCVGTDGNWTSSQSGGMWSSGSLSGDGGSGFFGTFLVLALLWSLIPLGIAAVLASGRGESIGMAIALTLVLGWIGLAIVYFGQSNTHQAATGLAQRAASPPPARATTPASPGPASLAPAPAPTPTAAPAAPAPEPDEPSVPERLRQLDELRRDEMLSDTEYAEQRRRILDSL